MPARYGRGPVLRDERGRFRKKRYEEMSALEKFNHDHLVPTAARLAKSLAESFVRDRDFVLGEKWGSDVLGAKKIGSRLRIRLPSDYLRPVKPSE